MANPRPTAQPPYYLNGYEHEDATQPYAMVRPDPLPPADQWDASPAYGRYRDPWYQAEDPWQPPARDNRTLWLIVLMVAVIVVSVLAIHVIG